MIETGIQFGNIHSYYDLNLVLSSVDIPPAQPKTNYINIPGGNGSIDLTEALGEVKYSDKALTFVFTMFPNDPLTFEEKKTQIANALNGKRFEKITVEKDLGYYYTGRCVVDSFLEDKMLRQFTVVATVNPYKLKQHETIVTVPLTSTAKTIVLTNGRKSVVPIITCSAYGAKIVIGNATYTLGLGTQTISTLVLKEGTTKMNVSGSGTMEFKYREGDL